MTAAARGGEFPQRQLVRNQKDHFLEAFRYSLPPLGRIRLLNSKSSMATKGNDGQVQSGFSPLSIAEVSQSIQ